MSLAIEPFTIDIPDADLVDLRERLARTRFSQQLPDAGWDYGTDRDYLVELVAYWRDEYDWRRAEATLNAFDNFLTEVDGTRVHFIHARSPEPDAFPLIVTHGWPGSVVEFLEIIGPLSDPRAHGGDAADAFHVVCPSIPGYGFSGPTTERGWGPRRIADGLGGAHGRPRLPALRRTGWRLGLDGLHPARRASTPSHVAGVHLNMIVAPPPADLDFANLRDDEQAALGGVRATTAGTIPGTRRSRAPSRRPSATRSTTRLRAWPLGSSRSSGRGATATATSRGVHEGPAARQHHAVLGHGHRPLRRRACTTRRSTRAGSCPPNGRVEVPIGVRGVPEGDHPLAPSLGGGTVRHPPLDRDAPRRAFCGIRTGRAPGERRPGVLPAVPRPLTGHSGRLRSVVKALVCALLPLSVAEHAGV